MSHIVNRALSVYFQTCPKQAFTYGGNEPRSEPPASATAPAHPPAVNRSANGAAAAPASTTPNLLTQARALGKQVVDTASTFINQPKPPAPAAAKGPPAANSTATATLGADLMHQIRQPANLAGMIGNPLLQPIIKPLLSTGGAPALFGITDLVRHGAHNFTTLTRGPGR